MRTPVAMEEDELGMGTKMVISADVVQQFVLTCADLAEARRSLPELTWAQFDAVRARRVHFTGDTKTGIRLVYDYDRA